jgi:hypothetical protein
LLQSLLGQPLASSNLASSTISHQARYRFIPGCARRHTGLTLDGMRAAYDVRELRPGLSGILRSGPPEALAARAEPVMAGL